MRFVWLRVSPALRVVLACALFWLAAGPEAAPQVDGRTVAVLVASAKREVAPPRSPSSGAAGARARVLEPRMMAAVAPTTLVESVAGEDLYLRHGALLI